MAERELTGTLLREEVPGFGQALVDELTARNYRSDISDADKALIAQSVADAAASAAAAAAADSIAQGRNYKRIWKIDPIAGNDNNTGIASAPFKTFAKAATVFQPGDEIRGVGRTGTTIVKENVRFGALNDGIFNCPGYVFHAYDRATSDAAGTTPAVWTETSAGSGIWKATVYLKTGNGGTTAHDSEKNKTYFGLMFDDGSNANKSAKIVPNGDTGTATEAALLSGLNAIAVADLPAVGFRNGPVVGGTVSGRTNGFVWGNHDIYVRPPVGVNPNSASISVQNRTQPVFGTGWELHGFTVFGGYGHNGVEMMDADLLGRIEIWYPSCHGSFIAGCQGVGPIIRGKNRTGAAGYAWHCFNGGPRKRRTYLRNPQVYGYNDELDNLFGGHGSNQGNDIIEMLEVDDLYAEDVSGVGNTGEATYPSIFRRPRVYGCTALPTGNADIYDPEIVGRGAGNGIWGNSAAGTTINVYGGSSASSPLAGWFRVHQPGAPVGAINFFDHRAIVCADRVIGAWWASSASSGIVNFTRCVLEAEAGVSALTLLAANNTGVSVTFTDCAVSGLALPAGAAFVRGQRGGRTGLRRGPRGQVAANDNVSAILGENVLALAAAESAGRAAVLTSKAIYGAGDATSLGSNLSLAGSAYTAALGGKTITGIVGAYRVNNFTRIVMYGPNSTLQWVADNASVNAVPTVVDTSAAPGKNWIGAISGGSDGMVWLLGDDGSITEYDVAAGTVTARASGVTYPLRSGFRVGNTIVACGSDAAGATATVGGVIVSTNRGASWSDAFTATDNATWAIRAKCVTYVNGTWCVFGSRGMFATSPTGVAGSWTVRHAKQDADIRVVASDYVASGQSSGPGSRIVWGGDAGLGANYRDGRMGYIDASDANPANWKHQAMVPPVGAVGPAILFQPLTLASGVMSQWLVAGQLFEIATSEDGRSGWRKATRSDALPPLYTGLAASTKRMLAAA